MALHFKINISYLITEVSGIVLSSQTSDAGIWLSLKYLPNIEFKILLYHKISPDTVLDTKWHMILHYLFALKVT